MGLVLGLNESVWDCDEKCVYVRTCTYAHTHMSCLYGYCAIHA